MYKNVIMISAKMFDVRNFFCGQIKSENTDVGVSHRVWFQV
jgi:hypothetical protein